MAGAPRFYTAFKDRGFYKKLVLFSGDLFGPSTLSDHYQGSNMTDFFKMLNVKASCLGNHETEYGLDRMTELI